MESTTFWMWPLAVLVLPGSLIFVSLSASLFKALKRHGLADRSNVFRMIFVSVMALNFLGLAPFVFSVTSWWPLAPVLACTIWWFVITTQADANGKEFVGHLLPEGAPFALAPLLILIETVSIIIRPITLSVRLIANIVVGHVLCGVIASFLRTLAAGPVTRSILPLLMMFYMVFEFGVVTIQAYVFALLLTLYSDDLMSRGAQ